MPSLPPRGVAAASRKRTLTPCWLAAVAVAALVVQTTSGTLAAERTAPGPRPNIVVVMADDLGFSDLGCYGSEIATPNLDRLATEGLRFTQFYNTAKCHSSRVCLMSGLYCYQAGNSSLSSAVTFADVLRQAGYFTAMTGKWHLKDAPTDHGFDRYFGHLSGATNYFLGDKSFRLNGLPFTDFGDDFYTTDANTDYALRFLDEAKQSGKPFLLYIADNAPHYPLQARKKDIDKYRDTYRVGWDEIRRARYRRQLEIGLVKREWGIAPRPDYVPAWEDLSDEDRRWEADRMAVFAAMVDRLDQNIGRLVDHLNEMGVLDDTLILFCSDNGACPFERTKGRQFDPWDPRSHWTYDVGWAHVGNTPFRLYKQNQHEGGISSPLIVHWPAGLKTSPGSLTDQAGHLIDVMATCVDLGGARYPAEFDGRKIAPLAGKSLRPIFEGKQRPGHDWLYFQFGTNRAIRQGDWKLVAFRGGPWELYDMGADRTELHDLAADQPDRVDHLRQLWQQIAQQVDDLPERLREPAAKKMAQPNWKRAQAAAKP